MDIHRQQCQACRSFDLRNIVVRETGRLAAVYVRCLGCTRLVARYELSTGQSDHAQDRDQHGNNQHHRGSHSAPHPFTIRSGCPAGKFSAQPSGVCNAWRRAR